MTRRQEERKADTRKRLLSAAAAAFARSGYHGASVDEIAAEADLSTGALYARFGSKAGLFVGLLDEGIGGWTAEYVTAVDDSPDVATGVGEAVAHWRDVLAARQEVVLLFMEFWSASMRDPELRPRMAESYARMRAAGAAIIEREARRLGVTLPFPAETLACLFIALGDGLALQRLVDPGAVPAERFADAVTKLFDPSPAGTAR
jgi:AcrR family transcriptional regulator